MSFFSNTPINIENIQGREEEESAEEQQRRQEEINDFLVNEFNPFHYDESTVNSSIASVDEAQRNTNQNVANHHLKETDLPRLNDVSTVERQLYKDTQMQDQLKVLYDVRVREINSLREEFENYKNEKDKEIAVLKNKAILFEAENHHTQTSLKNSESLLVEKTELIAQLKQELNRKDEETNQLKQVVKDLNLEICTYKSMVTELQLKHNDSNSFGLNSRKNHSEELQKAQNDQTVKLQSLLQEESKRCQVLEKQNARLENDIKKLIESKSEEDKENNLTIIGLSKKLQLSQQQCKDMFLLGDALKKESDHVKGRLQQIENNQFLATDEEENYNVSLDKTAVHTEKLKQMLLDRNVELNTLKAKLKFYDSDLAELFEYRKMINELSTMSIKRCSNYEHEELFIFMQGQLQSLEQAVEDRNNQIINLKRDKNELQEQIQQGIQQTRAELENLSRRYSLPQLETMNNELKNAEDKITTLKQQLIEKDAIIKKTEEKLGQFSDLEQDFKQIKADNNNLQKLIEELKNKELGLIEENTKIATLLNSQTEGVVNTKVTNVQKLYKLKQEIKEYINELKIQNSDFTNEVEKWVNCFDDCLSGSTQSIDNHTEASNEFKIELEKERLDLNDRIESRNKEIDIANEEIAALKELNLSYSNQIAENKLVLKQLTDNLHNLNKYLQVVEENKLELEEQVKSLQKQLSLVQEEVLNMHQQCNEKDTELVSKNGLGYNETKNQAFEKILQAEILKAELNLREKIQEETMVKMQNIEEQYSKALSEKSEIYNKDKDKFKQLEITYRKQLAAVLEECGKKMQLLENENEILIKQINTLVEEYKTYQNKVELANLKYQKMVMDSKRNTDAVNKKWIDILESYVRHFSTVQRHTQNAFITISNKIAADQKEIDLIDVIYNNRIKMLKKEHEELDK